MVNYIKKNEKYELYINGEKIAIIKDLYLLVDVSGDNIITLKHGEKGQINSIFAVYKGLVNTYPGMFNIFMIDLGSIELTEVNKILNNTGYFPKDLKSFILNAASLEKATSNML